MALLFAWWPGPGGEDEPEPAPPGSLRDAIVSRALAMRNIGAAPATRDAYLALIAPGETPNMQDSMAKMSGCGLTIGGFWRDVGIQHPSLDPPYKIGTAVSRLVELGKKMGGWVPYQKGALPSPGDMVLVGDNAGGGIEHVYTVIDAPSESAIVSVDGGQVDSEGFQVIREKNRDWSSGKDTSQLATEPGWSAGPRKIIGWVDVSKLEPLLAGVA